MSLLNLNIGQLPNDGTGDQLRTAFDKINNNFSNLFANDNFDNSIDYNKLSNSLKSKQAIVDFTINFSIASIFTKTLTAATELVFTNLQLNKVITVLIQGNFSLILPAFCKLVSGSYSGVSLNYISLHCTNADLGFEEVWYSVSQNINS